MVKDPITKQIEKEIQNNFIERSMGSKTRELLEEKFFSTDVGKRLFVASACDTNTIEVIETMLLFLEIPYQKNETKNGKKVIFLRIS